MPERRLVLQCKSGFKARLGYALAKGGGARRRRRHVTSRRHDPGPKISLLTKSLKHIDTVTQLQCHIMEFYIATSVKHPRAFSKTPTARDLPAAESSQLLLTSTLRYISTTTDR